MRIHAWSVIGLVALVACGDKDSSGDGSSDGVADPSDSTDNWGSGGGGGGDGSDGSDGGGGGRVGVCDARDLGSRVGQGLAEGSTQSGEDHYYHCEGSYQSEDQGDTPDAVFVWEAPSTGYYGINTVGSDYDTYLTLIEGDCDGAAFACDDDNGGDGTSYIEFEVANLAPITIVVDSYGSDGGNFVLNIVQFD